MLFDFDLRGDALPPKTLCLTFDDGPGQTVGDGPGPRTIDLGLYLAEAEIAATFFVVGSHVRANPGIIARLRAMGHLVGNHTDTHPVLANFLRAGGDVSAEIAQADLAIGSPSAEGRITFLRAPYGDWRDEPMALESGIPPVLSTVATRLNASRTFPHLVGPIGWDIDAHDWKFWKDGRSAEECGEAYLDAIEAAGRGIVLMHDSAESDPLRTNNRALDTICWLVPILLERGYTFVRLDEVPGVASACEVSRVVSLRTESNQWLTCPEAEPALALTPPGHPPGGCERFGIVPLGDPENENLVALRAWDGSYLTRTDPGAITPGTFTLANASPWELVEQPSGAYHLRSSRNEAITPGDHPHAIHLTSDPSSPLPFHLETVIAVYEPGTGISAKGG